MTPPATPSSTLVERLDALYEYDREPVAKNRLHGGKTFIAMFAGEHTAGTEFVLGPLFVMHGVAAFDAFVGLLLGNLLAVLSWAFFCAPVAVRTRLTIYWQIRKICGPYLTVIYSGCYALVLCLLAGAMVNVSATAIALPLGIDNPNYLAGEIFPSVPWMLMAAVVGVVIAVVAVLGFDRVAYFSKLCAPWMPLIFISAGIAVLPQLGCTSLSTFWETMQTRVFTGVPVEGVSKYGFWHVVGFAWLCNITQHIGMADVTIFRYAKHWSYGFASAFGMYLGHYVAWIASGILSAVALSQGIAANPGNIAWLGAGWAGIVCVVLAGWTTANPTLYRAGLAFQVATPNWRRWKVTFVAGALMIVAACVPAILHYLDRIVGYYGLFFMPLGAFIFIDVWLFPRLGLISSFAERTRARWSWPAGFAWFGALAFSVIAYGKDNYPWLAWVNDVLPASLARYQADLFFLVLPEWLVAVTLYTVFSLIQQRSTSLALQPQQA
ncbi:MAG TPA: hypothetical protein VHF69_12545 [Candidatus Synoicihabitans sp.]|nr:hypothetical protein [Candidatus Synoicihabitans sp.]